MKLLLLLLFFNLTHAGLPDKYNDLSAEQKRLILWENINQSLYSNELPELTATQFATTAFRAIDPFFVDKTFSTTSDEMPLQQNPITKKQRHRPKIIHTYGSTALVRFIPTKNHPFTGVFERQTLGLARVSIAAPLTFTPGMAVKFFLDDQPSVNIQVMHSLTLDKDNCHPFENNFSNIIPPPSGILKFAAVTFELIAKKRGGRANHLTLDHLAEVGTKNPKAPYQIILTPSYKAQTLKFNCDQDYRMTMFEELGFADKLYDIYANDKEDGEFIKVGKLVLESKFLASEYGDEVLFFQHDIRE